MNKHGKGGVFHREGGRSPGVGPLFCTLVITTAVTTVLTPVFLRLGLTWPKPPPGG